MLVRVLENRLLLKLWKNSSELSAVVRNSYVKKVLFSYFSLSDCSL